MEGQSPSAILKTLKTIHWSLVAGLSLFAAVVAFQLGTNPETTFFTPENPLVFIPVFSGIFLIPVSLVLFNRQMDQAKNKKELQDKLAGFQTAHIVKMAMLEGVGLFSLVACFVTFTTANFFLFALVIILMAGSAPTAFKLGARLSLSREEIQQLGNQ